MKNPFLINRIYTIGYAAAWILLAGIHALILWQVTGLGPLASAVDSLVFNLLFAGIGLGLWYSIRFYRMEADNVMNRIANHALIALVVLGIWLGIGYLALKGLLSSTEGYLDFLKGSIPWRAIVGAFLYSLLVLIYYLYINYEDRRTRMGKESALQLQVREAEIDRLKAQINPHFLFNSLNSVSSLILSKPEDAREMLVRLSAFLRYSLENRDSDFTTLERELENIRFYLQIEKVRFGERLLFRIDVPDACLRMQIPHMILQPLVENAIKHGVYESTSPVSISLVAKRLQTGDLHLEITNDYDPEAPPRKGKGIGLINTKNRLFLVYNCDDCLEVDKSGNRFTANLRIPQTPCDGSNG